MTGAAESSGDPGALFARVPEGYCVAAYDGRRWGVTRSVRAGGRRQWVYAEELGGTGVVSANLYLVRGSARLRPCEMPAADVLDFLARLEVVSGPPQTPTAPVPLEGPGPSVSGLGQEVRQ